MSLIALIIRTGYLQLVMGEHYLAMSNKRVANSVVVKAPRGEIYDRNGKPMISNRVGYALQFLKTDGTNDEIYEMLLKCLNILTDSGYIYEDSFPVDMSGNEYIFNDDNGDGSIDDEKSNWFDSVKESKDKKFIDLNKNMSASEVLAFYRNYYKISNDYNEYDYIIGMDSWNYKNILRITGGDPENKVHLLLEFAGLSRDIADPWYTGNFDKTYEDICEGCEAFLHNLLLDSKL